MLVIFRRTFTLVYFPYSLSLSMRSKSDAINDLVKQATDKVTTAGNTDIFDIISFTYLYRRALKWSGLYSLYKNIYVVSSAGEIKDNSPSPDSCTISPASAPTRYIMLYNTTAL